MDQLEFLMSFSNLALLKYPNDAWDLVDVSQWELWPSTFGKPWIKPDFKIPF